MSILGKALIKTSAAKTMELMGRPISKHKVDQSFTTLSRIKEAVSGNWIIEHAFSGGRKATPERLNRFSSAMRDGVEKNDWRHGNTQLLRFEKPKLYKSVERANDKRRLADDTAEVAHNIQQNANARHLNKKAAVSDEQAQSAVNRLDTLERNKPTFRQAARYGAIGAAAGPAMNLIGSAIAKKNPFKDTTMLRGLASDATKGAIAGGAVPLLRSHLDRRAEVGTLKNYLSERQKEAAFIDTIKQQGGKALAGLHHLENPIEVAGLASLAAAPVDNMVARHRAIRAGLGDGDNHVSEHDMDKYRVIKERHHDAIEAGGLGVLAAPLIAKRLHTGSWK